MHTLANSTGGVAGTIGGILGFILLIAGYWAPTFVAYHRRVTRRAQVLIINLLAGWTLVGWVVALVMAVDRNRDPRPVEPITPVPAPVPGPPTQP